MGDPPAYVKLSPFPVGLFYTGSSLDTKTSRSRHNQDRKIPRLPSRAMDYQVRLKYFTTGFTEESALVT